MISGTNLTAAGHEELIERVAALAREKFAGRADRHDREAIFPADDFADLFAAGLHAPCVPESFGGQGLGPGRDVYALWLMTKEIAKADMSMARCWEGHVNSQVLIDAFGTEEQKRRWFEGIVDGREIWVAWSGEPQSRIPGQKARFGTNVTRVEGGYLVDGTKVFATSAGHARQAILLVDIAGPGGARHAAGASGGVLLLVCDLAENAVTFDDSWWDPIGMRATVSYLARFDRCFIPDRDVLGQPGQYLAEGWQTRFAPHYGATFLGGAEAAFEYAHAYATKDERESDPYVEQRLGQMSLNIECAHLYLEHVSRLWDAGRCSEAMRAGIRARFLVEKWAAETVDHVIKACGARSLIRPSPIERIYRDLSIYARHDNADHLLATIGREALGKIHDVSFFHLEERPASEAAISAAANGERHPALTQVTMSAPMLQTEPLASGKQRAARRLRFHWSMSSAGAELKGATARAAYNGIPDLAAHVAYCEAAEACEMESLLTAFGFHRPDPIALAAALGVLTSKVKFMVAVRSGVISPTSFVQQVNTVSALTQGRICLNVVGGHTPKEQRAYGDFLSHDERYARTDEFLSICRALWAGEGPVSFKGAYYEIEDAVVKTPFVSNERRGPEIFLGGASDAALKLAVRHADCLWTLPRSPEEIAPRLQSVLESGTEVGLLLSIIARPSREEAVSDAYALLDRVGGKARQVHEEFSARSDSVAFTGTLALAERNGGDWLTPWLWTGAVPYLGAPAIALVGSYDEVAGAIRTYEEVGISQFLFMGWPDIEEMKRFAGEVRPRLEESHALIPS